VPVAPLPEAITNGNGTIDVNKSGNGTWALSGANTYTGLTTINDGGGTLAFRNASTSLPAATSITIGGSAGLTLLDDGAGTVNLGNNVNLNVVGTGERDGPTIFVGNNGGATTGSTIALGVVDLVAGGSDPRSTQFINVTGANGYRLQLGGLIIGKRADHGAPQINPTTAPVTIAGTVTQASGKLASDSTNGDRLELLGTATGNLISGVIQNAADYPSNPNAKPFNLLKGGTSTWALSNNNTYTGVTTVSGGVLRLDHANALPGGIGTTGGTSALTFNGGVIGLGVGNFHRDLTAAGTAAGVNFTGAGGWAAYGADRAVNLNNDSHAIVWADTNTGLNGQTLILGAADATHTVDFQHPLDLGAATRTVQVGDGAAVVDAKLSELLSGVGGGLTKTGAGTLLLLAANAYTGATIINQGTLRVGGAAVLGGAAGSAVDAGNIVFGQNLNSGALEFETAANLGPADQIRFRNTGGTAGQGGALKYVGTTDQTVSKAIQCDTTIGVRLESNSVGGVD
jgi:autotransporter-associated beta strand protein